MPEFYNWKMCCKVRQEFAKLSFRNGLTGSIPVSSAKQGERNDIRRILAMVARECSVSVCLVRLYDV